MHLMNLISYVCLMSLESIQEGFDPHGASHKGLGTTFELEVVLVVKLPLLTFLIHKSLNLLFPHFLTHAVLILLILMPTLMMLMVSFIFIVSGTVGAIQDTLT